MPSAVSMVSPHHKIIHSSVYSTSILPILSSIFSSRRSSADAIDHPVKVAVVGGGQSAAEVVIDLHSKLQDAVPLFPNADGKPARHEIDLIINRGSLKPSDDSPFSNEIFDPACTCVYRLLAQLPVKFALSNGYLFRSEEQGREGHGSQRISGDKLWRSQSTNYRQRELVVLLVCVLPSHSTPALRVTIRTADG